MNNEKITAAKQISIPSILLSYGHNPVEQRGNELIYFSPFGNERTPSFKVNYRKNVFLDFSSGNKGDSISLIRLLEPMTFHEAITKALSIENTISFSFSGLSYSKESKIEIRVIQSIENSYLIDYLLSRKISIEIARIWLKEIHFTNNNKRYFGLGFQNDSGGYELRNGLGFKAKTSNGITSIEKGTNSVSIFEGFFDYLSALMHYGIEYPNNTTYILNTTANYKLLLPLLNKANSIYCFLDNDKAGENLFEKLIKDDLKALNMSKMLYPNSKDFNDYWSNKSQ
jgi:DNA primase